MWLLMTSWSCESWFNVTCNEILQVVWIENIQKISWPYADDGEKVLAVLSLTLPNSPAVQMPVFYLIFVA